MWILEDGQLDRRGAKVAKMTDIELPKAIECQHPSVGPIGLTSDEAHRRLTQFGPNTVSEAVPPRWLNYLAKFWSPIGWLLEGAMIFEFVLGKYVEAGVIAGLLLFNATLGFIQEGRAGAALAALKKRLAPTALVLRDSQWIKLPASEVVPDDIITLPLGALVPADASLTSGSVMLDQSMLTGEFCSRRRSSRRNGLRGLIGPPWPGDCAGHRDGVADLFRPGR